MYNILTIFANNELLEKSSLPPANLIFLPYDKLQNLSIDKSLGHPTSLRRTLTTTLAKNILNEFGELRENRATMSPLPLPLTILPVTKPS